MKAHYPFRFARDDRGAAAVEFALVSIPFFALIFGIASIAMILYTDAAVHWAVERSARTASMQSAKTYTFPLVPTFQINFNADTYVPQGG
jgi:Flp pilus assembly protein TadG